MIWRTYDTGLNVYNEGWLPGSWQEMGFQFAGRSRNGIYGASCHDAENEKRLFMHTKCLM